MEHYPVVDASMPQPMGHYSQAVRAGDFLFIAGTPGIDLSPGVDASTARAVPGDFETEARKAFENLAAILQAADSGLRACGQDHDLPGEPGRRPDGEPPGCGALPRQPSGQVVADRQAAARPSDLDRGDRGRAVTFRDFARVPGAEVHDDRKMLWYAAPSNNSWLNGASRSILDAEDADAAIDRVVATIHARGPTTHVARRP